jgi:FkbM family methyltransferase
MNYLYRHFIALLPRKIQSLISVIYFHTQDYFNRLSSTEQEFYSLKKWICKGDVVIDIGSNIGRYSFALSKIVGPNGHVYSFEPLTRIFFILSALTYLGNYRNITLINAAVGEAFGIVNIPENWTPPKNNYIFHTNTASKISHLDGSTNPNTKAVNSRRCLKLDDINIVEKIKFIKIDVEGLEYAVLKGAKNLILRDRPIILAESNDPLVAVFLAELGYKESKEFPKSRNKTYTPI